MDSVSERGFSSKELRTYVCEHCFKTFSTEYKLKRHRMSVHNPQHPKCTKLKCPLSSCEFLCDSHRELRIHLHEPAHNISFTCYERTFKSLQGNFCRGQEAVAAHYASVFLERCMVSVGLNMACETLPYLCVSAISATMSSEGRDSKPIPKHMKDRKICHSFYDWKAAEEEESKTNFMSYRRVTKSDHQISSFYYVCNRSRFYAENLFVGRKVQCASHKINGTCPAAITGSVSKGRVHVVYHKTHVGHSCEMRFVRLRKFEQDYLAVKLLQGFSINKILEDIKNDESLVDQRIHMITKKNVQKVMSLYGIKLKDKDLKNVEKWVEQVTDFPSSPVLIYKPYANFNYSLNLCKEDFMLGIMTAGQKEVFSMMSHTIVGISCSLNSNSHGFFLITVFVVDQDGIPFPLAYCITSRTDGDGIATFLEAVKQTVGDIKAYLLLFDSSQTCYQAWVKIMEKPLEQVLYLPHLHHHWKRKLQKIIVSEEKQKTVYDSLVALSVEQDYEKFELHLKEFIDKTESDDELKEFESYFKNEFLNKTDLWAFCQYAAVGLPTVTHLEKLHHRLNDICFENDLPKGMDVTVRGLLLMTHEKVYEQIIKLYRGTEFLLQSIVQNHKLGEQYQSFDIEPVEDSGKWTVKSSEDESVYTVHKMSDHPDKRELYCRLCKVFLDPYFCNCIDFLVMGAKCEHVHAVASASDTQIEIISLNEDIDISAQTTEDGSTVISCEETVDLSDLNSNANVQFSVVNFEVISYNEDDETATVKWVP